VAFKGWSSHLKFIEENFNPMCIAKFYINLKREEVLILKCQTQPQGDVLSMYFKKRLTFED